jgi:hypothetical protein
LEELALFTLPKSEDNDEKDKVESDGTETDRSTQASVDDLDATAVNEESQEDEDKRDVAKEDGEEKILTVDSDEEIHTDGSDEETPIHSSDEEIYIDGSDEEIHIGGSDDEEDEIGGEGELMTSELTDLGTKAAVAERQEDAEQAKIQAPPLNTGGFPVQQHQPSPPGANYSGASGYASGSGPDYRWFTPGEGIRRDVIQADVQRYLGPDALVKPGVDHNGHQGYWVAAFRTFTPVCLASYKNICYYISDRFLTS